MVAGSGDDSAEGAGGKIGGGFFRKAKIRTGSAFRRLRRLLHGNSYYRRDMGRTRVGRGGGKQGTSMMITSENAESTAGFSPKSLRGFVRGRQKAPGVLGGSLG